MRRPRILVIGRNGQVGWELMRTLAPVGEVAGIDHPEIDFTDPASVRRELESQRPGVIVNASAYTAVDRAESEPGPCEAINGEAPGVLGEEAAKLGSLLVHFSTDYVYDGTKGTPYVETDAPNPLMSSR